MTVPGDNPIKTADQDRLGRAGFAAGFAREIRSVDASEGLVVGVLGAWGSGKTSFVNLTRERLEADGIAVLEFNPWMFSGAEQLVESFFIELAAQLRLKPGRLADLGNDLEEYGESFAGLGWVPLVGTWIERARGVNKVLSAALKRRKEGVGARRKKLTDALAALDAPIVVVVDDIDRLDTKEIRDIFKLVRLTASFPNLIYLVAFDRARVEDALREDGIPGRDYLEKILQVAVDLPQLPDEVLRRQVAEAIQGVLSDIDNPGPFDSGRWPDVFVEVIRPLVRSPRDLRRYAAGIHGTVMSLDGQISLVDVLALEAIRIFLPDTFGALGDAGTALTATGYDQYADPARQRLVEALVDLSRSSTDTTRAMVKRLFPAADRHIGGTNWASGSEASWRRDRRVAHIDFLRLYLERSAPAELAAFSQAELLFSMLTDVVALTRALHSIEPDRLEDVISALEAFESEYPVEAIEPAVTALMNVWPTMPKRDRGMFELDTRMVVGRVVYRLLRRLADDPARLTATVRNILPELTTLSSKFEVITDVGHRENAGHKLVSETDAAALEREFRDEVRGADPANLSKEQELLRILLNTKRDADASEPQLELPDDPALNHALLLSARSEVLSSGTESRTVHRSYRMHWEVLVDLVGTEDELRRRIDSARAHNPEPPEMFELLDRYLSGWRPADWDDE